MLREQWNSLVLASEFPQVFYTYEWALALHQIYSKDLEPYLWLAYKEDSLIGVASLAKNTLTEEICFLAGSTADYCDFISAPHERGQFVAQVIEEMRKLGLAAFSFANLPAQSGTIAPLKKSARAHGYTFFVRPAFNCARVVLTTSEQRSELKCAIQGKEMFRRKMKSLQKIGSVTYEHLRSPEEIAGALPDFFNAQIGRALQMDRISNLARPERQNFLRALAAQLSQRKAFALDRLVTDKKVVAWNYGFQFAGTWFWYQPAMEPAFQQYSPGFCLLSKIIEEACDQPTINCVDLGLGGEEYKNRFVTDFQKTVDISVQNSKFNYYLEACRYYLAACIKQVPALDRWLRMSLRSRLSRLGRFFRRGSILGFLKNMKNVATSRLFGKIEISFFEYCGTNIPNCSHKNIHIEPLTLGHLAVAAREYFGDPETLTYLIRAAKRLQKKDCEGFTVINGDGVPVQFCWAAKFAGFYMNELRVKLKSPEGGRLLLFDCWTPFAMRRQGFYTAAISNTAQALTESGHDVWIFSEVGNIASKKGIRHAGFSQRYSLSRRRYFGIGRVVRSEKNPSIDLQPAELVA